MVASESNGLTGWKVALFASLMSFGCGEMLADEAPVTVETVPADVETIDVLQQHIIGGRETTGDLAVVGVGANGSTNCTGTLIGTQTVLTAAHCILSQPANGNFIVVFGSRISDPNVTVVGVEQVFVNPSYTGTATVPGTGDIALMKLRQRVRGVDPIPLHSGGFRNADLGRNARYVGFGRADANSNAGSGTKREVTAPLSRVSQLEIFSERAGVSTPTCQGDSGGPAFMVMPGNTREAVIGVAASVRSGCVDSAAHGRVEAFANYIRNTVSWENLGTCAQDNVCVPGCTPAVDPDCACAADGVCSAACVDKKRDPDCKALGAECTQASECQGSQCVNDAQHQELYCSQSCSTAAACPQGMECAQSVCRFVQQNITPEDSVCDATSTCEAGTVCAGPNGEMKKCRPGCVDNICGEASQECVVDSGGAKYCAEAGENDPEEIGAGDGSGSGGITSVPGVSGAPVSPNTAETGGTDALIDLDSPNALVSGGCSAAASAPTLTFASALLALVTRRRRRNL